MAKYYTQILKFMVIATLFAGVVLANDLDESLPPVSIRIESLDQTLFGRMVFSDLDLNKATITVQAPHEWEAILNFLKSRSGTPEGGKEVLILTRAYRAANQTLTFSFLDEKVRKLRKVWRNRFKNTVLVKEAIGVGNHRGYALLDFSPEEMFSVGIDFSNGTFTFWVCGSEVDLVVDNYGDRCELLEPIQQQGGLSFPIDDVTFVKNRTFALGSRSYVVYNSVNDGSFISVPIFIESVNKTTAIFSIARGPDVDTRSEARYQFDRRAMRFFKKVESFEALVNAYEALSEVTHSKINRALRRIQVTEGPNSDPCQNFF